MQICTHGEIRSDSIRHEMIYANEILTHKKGEYVGTFMGTYCSRKKYTWQETNANNHQVRLVWSESLIIKS